MKTPGTLSAPTIKSTQRALSPLAFPDFEKIKDQKMNNCEFSKQVMLTVLDKGLLALIVLLAGFYLNRALEGIKSRLSREQDFVKTVNVAVVDLAKKLASGNHLVSWLSWSATQPENSLSAEDFNLYDKDMVAVLSDLVGLQASVAAVAPDKFEVLSPFAQKLYEMDVEVGRARDLFKCEPQKLQRCLEILRAVHAKTEYFEPALLKSVTGLLIIKHSEDAIRGT
ncbi:hypothetical protein [Paraburkholderia fungorum]|uniref:hypothetical protein n=1 Tax=Paraburkholderia fungorum TaxID=134537 RepID=UPI0038BCA022